MEKYKKAIQLQKSLGINKAYAQSVENFHRSIKVLEDKNHAEVEKSQKIRIKKTKYGFKDMKNIFSTNIFLLTQEQKINFAHKIKSIVI